MGIIPTTGARVAGAREGAAAILPVEAGRKSHGAEALSGRGWGRNKIGML